MNHDEMIVLLVENADRVELSVGEADLYEKRIPELVDMLKEFNLPPRYRGENRVLETKLQLVRRINAYQERQAVIQPDDAEILLEIENDESSYSSEEEEDVNSSSENE